MVTSYLFNLLNTVRGEKGQGLVEYALILVLVSVVLIGALGFLADDIEAAFDAVGDALAPVAG
ncbi:MAG: Flp family type IVb pilin [Dehalococcoidia bacterium]|nr:Flp family type IVb pilin [Dehalococcoidia bacterium]